ncbi:peptidyl-tRNA hydrolase [Kribbella aluminosa]|uniref:peptidyl-tRNA hydrolase n=1 Tax=Kribbella aluminosa TaxID=416017 RepID=A0ABS4UDY7_9ACTN|nr:peptidyl-tRNA hydrolase [Kribbella aluminosa]MBP2349851.1 peptidyl-tRNA hydrolase [Kribbella aluminosa]
MEQVLTLVVRVEKKARPSQTDALETAARAVLAILADERSYGEGEWAEAMSAWQDNRIRKITKRARGIEWRRAEALPGITITGTGVGAGGNERADEARGEGIGEARGEGADEARGEGAGESRGEGAGEARGEGAGESRGEGGVPAEVRVFPPTGVDDVPPELVKLQVSGTDFEDTADLPPLEPGVPVLWINPALEMSSGKAMAQCGHAAQLAWWSLPDAARKDWQSSSFRLSVRTATPAHWSALLKTTLPVVQDAGFTEIAPGSKTVIADHPLLTR